MWETEQPRAHRPEVNRVVVTGDPRVATAGIGRHLERRDFGRGFPFPGSSTRPTARALRLVTRQQDCLCAPDTRAGRIDGARLHNQLPAPVAVAVLVQRNVETEGAGCLQRLGRDDTIADMDYAAGIERELRVGEHGQVQRCGQYLRISQRQHGRIAMTDQLAKPP